MSSQVEAIVVVAVCVFTAFAIFFSIWKKASQNVLPEQKSVPLEQKSVVSSEIVIAKTHGSTRVYSCGHTAPRQATISIYGEERELTDDAPMCPACTIEKFRPMIIRCAKCGKPIYPGDGVAVYRGPTGLDYSASGYRTSEGALLGCLRMSCCPTGGLFGGNWSGEEFRSRFGGRSAIEEAIATKRPVAGDTRTPS